MKKFSCTLCFSLNHGEIRSVLKESLNVLGFTAGVMYVKSEELSADLTYTKDEFFALLEYKRNFGSFST